MWNAIILLWYLYCSRHILIVILSLIVRWTGLYSNGGLGQWFDCICKRSFGLENLKIFHWNSTDEFPTNNILHVIDIQSFLIFLTNLISILERVPEFRICFTFFFLLPIQIKYSFSAYQKSKEKIAKYRELINDPKWRPTPLEVANVSYIISLIIESNSTLCLFPSPPNHIVRVARWRFCKYFLQLFLFFFCFC